ncbi:MAG: topoisomerase DNA-binding C4 zinc finger domain-containing protein [Thaumarchaeota archaeon]|nr:topoisomerase DNA-binding C4 zinc finger domain-containing protein [Nitrososphaerota archaeon]MDE1868007.1 topoisomerase DNA-binding C4 zinc finger domain-containing protein [Nitrososphaerota archaeon]
MKENVCQLVVFKKRSGSRNSVRITDKKVVRMKDEIRQYYDKNGYLSWSERKRKYIILGTNTPANGLVGCPECGIGKILVIRSRQTRKRFMGCSNYYNGCRASSPLIQRGMIYATKIPCKICFWPMILFRYSMKQKWTRQCCNIQCSSRIAKS